MTRHQYDPHDPEVQLRRRGTEDLGPLFAAPPSVAVDTSRQAAAAIAPRAGTLRALVLGFLKQYGPMTAEQLEEISGLDGNTIRPRLVELRAAGRVEMTDDKRPTKSGGTARLWRAREAA